MTAKAKPDPLLDMQLDNERALLGCALLAPDETRSSCGWLAPERFHDGQAATFWARFLAGAEPHELALDMRMYGDMLAWMNAVPSYFHAVAYATQIARGDYLASAQPVLTQIAQAAGNLDVAGVQRLAAELAGAAPQAGRTVRNAGDVAGAFLEALDADLRNIPTFIAPIDAATAGLERQTESVIAARPSQGKSTLAFQIARNVAVSGAKALFVSLEMSEVNLWARAACPLVGATWLDVRAGRVTGERLERLRNKSSELAMSYGDRLLIHDKPADTAAIWEICQAERPDLVVVDHLSLVADHQRDENEVLRLGNITKRLKQMAKALDLHVCILVQLNRLVEHRGTDSPPVLIDIRDSGKIEENADLVLMLHGEAPPKDGKARDTAKCDVWIRKARDGQRDVKIELVYDFRRQWFESANSR